MTPGIDRMTWDGSGWSTSVTNLSLSSDFSLLASLSSLLSISEGASSRSLAS